MWNNRNLGKIYLLQIYFCFLFFLFFCILNHRYFFQQLLFLQYSNYLEAYFRKKKKDSLKPRIPQIVWLSHEKKHDVLSVRYRVRIIWQARVPDFLSLLANFRICAANSKTFISSALRLLNAPQYPRYNVTIYGCSTTVVPLIQVEWNKIRYI